MTEVTLHPITGLGGFAIWCKGMPSYDTVLPHQLEDYITSEEWNRVVSKLNVELGSRCKEIDDTIGCGIAWLFTGPMFWMGFIWFAKADQLKKGCKQTLRTQMADASRDGITWSFQISDNSSSLKVRVAKGTKTVAQRESLKQMEMMAAQNQNMAPVQQSMQIPYATAAVAPPASVTGPPPLPTMSGGPPPAPATVQRTFSAKSEGASDKDELAEQFTPANKLEEMQPYIQQLKEFEEKLDTSTATNAQEEKEIRDVFDKVRELLQAQAAKALEKPAYINATFMKYHGRHLDAYDVAHNKGSGADPAHEATVKLATELKEKAMTEYPAAQQSTLSPIVLVKQAIELKQYYQVLVTKIAEKSGGELVLPPGRQLKGLYRIVEKSAMRHGEMQNMCNNVFDVLRGMILFTDDETLGKAVKMISEEADIVRVKERLSAESRTSEGWGDIMVNFRLKLPAEATISAGTEDHICEVQFARRKMYDMRTSLGGHDEYVWFRAAEELHTVNSIDLPTTKLSTIISNKLTTFQSMRRFSQCGKLQDLRSRVITVEQNIEETSEQMAKCMEMGDFDSCAQLQERESYFVAERTKLQQEFESVCEE